MTDAVTQLQSLLNSVVQALESVNKQSEKKNLQIECQTLMLEKLRDEIRMLREQNGRMKKKRFGSSSLKNRKGKKSSDSKKSRDEEEQDFDGSYTDKSQFTDESLQTIECHSQEVHLGANQQV